MNLYQKTKAAELALALACGYAELQDAVEWADEQIAQSNSPNSRLIDLSLARGPGEAAGYLRALSEGTNKWLNLSFFLSRFYSTSTMHPAKASRLAEHLYFLTVYDDPPKQFRAFSSHWDAIDLSKEGITGDPEVCVQNFLDDIRGAVEANGGPKFAAFRD